MDIEDIKLFVTDLTAPQQSEFVKRYADDLLSVRDLTATKELLDFLTAKLNEQGQKIATTNPTLYDQYEKYWINLALKAFTTLETVDQQNLFQQRLLFAIQNGCDLDELYREFFAWRGRLPETQTFVRTYIKDLEQNSETLGNVPLEVEGRKLMPQLKYWFLDYSKFPSAVSKRTSIERLNYINKSSNTRTLTQSQRQTLLSALKFYDDLISAEMPPKQRTPDYGVGNSRGVSARPASPPQAPRPETPQPQVMYRPQGIDIQKKLEDLKQRVK